MWNKGGNMALYELNQQQHNNLLMFLGRAQMVGNEVSAFNEVVNALQKPADPKRNPISEK